MIPVYIILKFKFKLKRLLYLTKIFNIYGNLCIQSALFCTFLIWMRYRNKKLWVSREHCWVRRKKNSSLTWIAIHALISSNNIATPIWSFPAWILLIWMCKKIAYIQRIFNNSRDFWSTLDFWCLWC